MRITKFGHSCIRIEHADQVIVIDPGGFTDPEAVDGATAVLITHEHADHYHPANLRACSAPIFTISAVAAKLAEEDGALGERTTVVRPGTDFELGSGDEAVPVEVFGKRHAVIHPDFPGFDNSGYLLRVGEEMLFHPGDSLAVPQVNVDVLFAPVCAPWLKTAEAIDFARAVGAPRNIGIHDRVYSEAYAAIATTHLTTGLVATSQEYVFLSDGADLR